MRLNLYLKQIRVSIANFSKPRIVKCDYRVLFEIEEGIIIIYQIKHRQSAYN